MLGNVWEWCLDWYDWDYYATAPINNPVGPLQEGFKRVVRGGSWNFSVRESRSANRFYGAPTDRHNDFGFRVALVPSKSDSTTDHLGAELTSAAKAMPALAVAPFSDSEAKQHQKAWADYLGSPVQDTNAIGMKLSFTTTSIIGPKTRNWSSRIE